jgi:hypothetical protein
LTCWGGPRSPCRIGEAGDTCRPGQLARRSLEESETSADGWWVADSSSTLTTLCPTPAAAGPGFATSSSPAPAATTLRAQWATPPSDAGLPSTAWAGGTASRNAARPRPEIGRIAERRPRQTTLKARMAHGAAWHPRAHISGSWHPPDREGMGRSHRFVPPPIPHPDETGRYQAARSYHSRVVIRNQDDTRRHQTTRQTAHLKTTRAAKPSGVRIPLPPPISLRDKGFLIR